MDKLLKILQIFIKECEINQVINCHHPHIYIVNKILKLMFH